MILQSQISPRLSWKDIYTLSSVSKSWEAIIKSRQIFQARYRSTFGSKDTLFAVQGIRHESEEKDRLGPLVPWNITLYSLEDPLQQSGARCGRLYALPPNPHDEQYARDKLAFRYLRAFPFLRDECIFLEGKLYIFRQRVARAKFIQSNMYVYDLVTQEQWKPCSLVEGIGEAFQYGVIDRKIFVFAESGDLSVTYAVYDPQGDSWWYVNSWSPFKSALKSKWPAFQDKDLYDHFVRWHQNVTPIGEELYVYAAPTCNYDKVSESNNEARGEVLAANVYHTVTHKWRSIEDVRRHEWDVIMWVDDRMHRIDRDCMEIYDTDTDQWTLKRLSSFSKDLREQFRRLELKLLVESNRGKAEFDELVRVNHQEVMHFSDGTVVKDRIFFILNWRLEWDEEEGWSSGSRDPIVSSQWIVSSRWTTGQGDTEEEVEFELWDSCCENEDSGDCKSGDLKLYWNDRHWLKCAVQL